MGSNGGGATIELWLGDGDGGGSGSGPDAPFPTDRACCPTRTPRDFSNPSSTVGGATSSPGGPTVTPTLTPTATPTGGAGTGGPTVTPTVTPTAIPSGAPTEPAAGSGTATVVPTLPGAGSPGATEPAGSGTPAASETPAASGVPVPSGAVPSGTVAPASGSPAATETEAASGTPSASETESTGGSPAPSATEAASGTASPGGTGGAEPTDAAGSSTPGASEAATPAETAAAAPMAAGAAGGPGSASSTRSGGNPGGSDNSQSPLLYMAVLAVLTGIGAVGAGVFKRRPDIARRIAIGGTAAVALMVVALVAFGKDTSATSYNPTSQASIADGAAGASSNYTVNFDIPGGDANFSSVVSFTPPDWTVVNCTASNAAPDCADAAVPDGAFAARLDSTATLGLLNGACTNTIGVGFDLMDATTNMGSTTVYQDTNGNGTGEQFEDANGNGIPDGTDMYPDYLTRLLRDAPYPGGSPLQPIQRLYGQTEVAGTDVSLNFLLFAPGTTVNGITIDPALGYPSVAVLNNTGDPEGVFTPSAITDFCTPLSTTTTTFGTTQNNPDTSADESGVVNRTNPGSDGTFTFVIYTASQRDADDDGIENALDPCATQGNAAGWDPRSSSGQGDADLDGLPDDCDPAAAAPNADEDGDAWQNRGDNCPLTSNADARDIDIDGIGDACDPDPSSPTGHNHELCLTGQVTIGAGGAANDPSQAPPCGSSPSTAAPTDTPAATDTPAPTGGETGTPAPTDTGGASGTPAPSDTGPLPTVGTPGPTDTGGASGTPAPSGTAGASGTPAPTGTVGGQTSTPAASGTAAPTTPPSTGGGGSPTPTRVITTQPASSPQPTTPGTRPSQTTSAGLGSPAPTSPGTGGGTTAPTPLGVGGGAPAAGAGAAGVKAPTSLPSTGGPAGDSTSGALTALLAALIMIGLSTAIIVGWRKETE